MFVKRDSDGQREGGVCVKREIVMDRGRERLID